MVAKKASAEAGLASAETDEAFARTFKTLVEGNITWVQLSKTQADYWMTEIQRLSDVVSDLNSRLSDQESKNHDLQIKLSDYMETKHKLVTAEKQIDILTIENKRLKQELNKLKASLKK